MNKTLKTKDCPKCKIKIGAKTRTCKCGHKFIFFKNIKNSKKCPECTKELRPRAKDCSCGYVYPIKKKGYEEVTKNWIKLRRGDIIYIRKGGKGPYYITETDGGKPAGTKFLMGYRGKFRVLEIHKDGIRCYSDKEAVCFIYMGKTEKNELTGVIRRKHRLWRKAI